MALATSELPEITDVQRLRLEPGDRLIVRIGERKISPQTADLVKQRVRAMLHLDDSVPL